MALIVNINCKWYLVPNRPDISHGICTHYKQRKLLGLFYKKCPLVENRNAICDLQEKYPKPKGPPPPPPPRRYPKPQLTWGELADLLRR